MRVLRCLFTATILFMLLDQRTLSIVSQEPQPIISSNDPAEVGVSTEFSQIFDHAPAMVIRERSPITADRTCSTCMISETNSFDLPTMKVHDASPNSGSDFVPVSDISGHINRVDISGPTTGCVQTPYTFTASISPVTAVQPITYIWQATGYDDVVTHTNGGLSDTTPFTWTTGGTRAITVTAMNRLSTVINTHFITISVSPISVAIGGPTVGSVDIPYIFSASVSPVTTTLPITYIWQATGYNDVVTHTNGGLSDTITFTWIILGPQTVTVTATGVCSAVVGTHVIAIEDIEEFKLHLPLVMRFWPPVPQLCSIENADGDGNYVVCWNAVDWGNYYALEEATSSTFTSPTRVYTGTSTCNPISGKGAAQYCYRVAACANWWSCSAWSNVERVDVLWEQEDNDSYSTANGPLSSGVGYYGYHDDQWDFFNIYLTTTGQISIGMATPLGQGAQLHLFDQNYIRRKYTVIPPHHIEWPGDANKRYYIGVGTGAISQPPYTYTLQITFP